MTINKQFFDAYPTENVERTREGFLKATVKITRTGIFEYRDETGAVIKMLRHPDDVFRQESLESIKLVPITLNHPSPLISADRLVSSANADQLVIGAVGEGVRVNAPFIETNIVLYNKDGIEQVEKEFQEISMGYTADIVDEAGEYNGEYYTKRQINIIYNHFSFVKKGRAGPEVRINIDEEDNDMPNNTRRIMVDNASHEVPEEVAVMIDNLVMDAAKLRDSVKVAEKARDDANASLEKTTGELDAVKEQLDAAMEKSNDKAISDAAKERLAILRDSEKVLGKVIDNADSMSNMEIIKHVVETASKVKLDGKKDEYIMGRYEALLSTVVDDAKAKVQRQVATINSPSGQKTGKERTALDAYQEMVGRYEKKPKTDQK